MRDFARLDGFLNRLQQDVYSQPADIGHTAWAAHAVDQLCSIPQGLHTVLDLGCGQGFLAPVFTARGMAWTGVALGEDAQVARAANLPVYDLDYSFLPWGDGSFDLIFARHALEHSPMPLVTLMEWRRVVTANGYLALIAPAPAWWGVRGRNHYAVLYKSQLKWLLERTGWRVVHDADFTSHNPAFIVPWQAALVACGHAQKGKEPAAPEMDVVVEYRLLCAAAEEVTE